MQNNQEQIEWDAKEYAESIPNKITCLLLELSQAFDEGYLEGLKTYIELKKFEGFFEDVKEKIYNKAIDDADSYPEKTFKAFGATIEKSSAGAKWYFKGIPQWDNLEKAKKSYELKLKTAFQMAEKGDTYVEEGGEVVPIPKYTPGKTIIKIKL